MVETTNPDVPALLELHGPYAIFLTVKTLLITEVRNLLSRLIKVLEIFVATCASLSDDNKLTRTPILLDIAGSIPTLSTLNQT